MENTVEVHSVSAYSVDNLMGNLSKLAHALGMQISTANCYETIHTWEPNCYKATWQATPGAFLFCLKTYFSFYFLATLVSKRGNLKKVDWGRFIRDVLQSSVFLTMNMIFFLMYLCQLRHLLGFFTPISMGFISSCMASFSAILFEKPSRRSALALYLTNLASETLFRQLVNFGYIKPIPHGIFIPFSVGLGLFMYLYSKERLSKSLTNMLSGAIKLNVSKEILDGKKLPDDFHAFLHKLRTDFGRTKNCEHVHSCVSVCTEGFIKKTSLLAWAQLISMLFAAKNFKIPLFVGLLPLIFNASRCSLNRVDGISKTVRNVASGSLAGLSMLVFPNVSIAMYCMWKAIESLYFDLVDRGYLPLVPHGEIILYTITTGYVLWQVIVQPHAIRSGYLNFLGGLVGNRYKIFNRVLIDEFGYHSRVLFDAKLDLDPRYVTINPMLYKHLAGTR
ncbi:unnamed protein product [Caenorhabditis auriculariae]|uniref:Transmembrane protein 135 N-terminal domain-containing protein n=1 Tax=Caenorhabditis auriculariae TaxID=2777116 RepID=A0A8S1HHA9_9PELO|nr:unnamed protein product [Caenorhabditis auriculariae]